MKRTSYDQPNPWIEVRGSTIHGCGVFAKQLIPAGSCIIEYMGEHISSEEADARHPVNPDEPNHTFFFSLSTGDVIDGHQGGNLARWINHSCEPNCEAQETDDGRVFIYSLFDIEPDQELSFDYALEIDMEYTQAVKDQFMCSCKTPSCRGTMLALP